MDSKKYRYRQTTAVKDKLTDWTEWRAFDERGDNPKESHPYFPLVQLISRMNCMSCAIGLKGNGHKMYVEYSECGFLYPGGKQIHMIRKCVKEQVVSLRRRDWEVCIDRCGKQETGIDDRVFRITKYNAVSVEK